MRKTPRGIRFATAAIGLVALIVSAGSAGIVRAGSMSYGGDWAQGSGLRCSTGRISANLPVVAADTAGLVWQISQLYSFDGVKWVARALSDWIGYSRGQWESFDGFSVPAGHYYAIRQLAYVDGGWIDLYPFGAGPDGRPYPVCLA